MTQRIYTRTGDAGQTSLFGGERVGKDDLRVEAYGTVDELNAALGVVRARSELSFDPLLATIQSTLFELGGDLATPPSASRRPAQITDEDVTRMESAIDEHDAKLDSLKSFVLPGGCASAADLHLARTICRRAERCVVKLHGDEPATSERAIRYLNRVGDLLFVLARLANHESGVPDVPWHPRTAG
ncbi:MAG: cob(I)yrinic acid a,c-diamide adenosyltransferase [Myxococcota bacterium]